MLPKVMQVKNFGKVSPDSRLISLFSSSLTPGRGADDSKRHPEQNIPILQTKIHQVEDGATSPDHPQEVRVVLDKQMKDVGIVVDRTRGKIVLITIWQMIPCRSYRGTKVPVLEAEVLEVIEEVVVVVGRGAIYQLLALDLALDPHSGKVGQEDQSTVKKVKNADLTRKERGMKGTVREDQEMREVGVGMNSQEGRGTGTGKGVGVTPGKMIGGIGIGTMSGMIGAIGIENVNEAGVRVQEERKMIVGEEMIGIGSVIATGIGIGIVDDSNSKSTRLLLLHVRYYQDVCTIDYITSSIRFPLFHFASSICAVPVALEVQNWGYEDAFFAA